MPTRKLRVKKETRVDKVTNLSNKVCGRLKSTERTGCGKPKHTRSAAQASSPCVRQSRRATYPVVLKQLEI
jgi:hypothetical protein